jgi:hypothetical protein
MKGGSVTIYGPRAYNAFCEFASARKQANARPDPPSRPDR